MTEELVAVVVADVVDVAVAVAVVVVVVEGGVDCGDVARWLSDRH